MMRRIVVAALVAAAAPSAAAQTVGVTGGAVAQEYEFSDPESVRVVGVRVEAVPVGVDAQINPWLAVQAGGMLARVVTTSPWSGSRERSGLAQLGWTVRFTPVPDRVEVLLRGSEPQPGRVLTLEAASIAGVLAGDLLPFAIDGWTEGRTLGGDLLLSAPIGPVRLRVAGGYHVPVTDLRLVGSEYAYRPAKETRFALGLDVPVGAAALRATLLMRGHGDDQLYAEPVFDAASRTEASLSLAVPLGERGGARAFVSARMASAAEPGTLLRSPATMALLRAQFPGLAGMAPRRLLRAGAQARLGGARAALVPEVEVRSLRSATDQCPLANPRAPVPFSCAAEDGWLATVGAALEARLAAGRSGDALVVAPFGRWRTGHWEPGAHERSDVTGWEAGVAVRMEVAP